MTDSAQSPNFDYWKLQYEEGGKTIRYATECRHKILQFSGYYNAAVLTFGFKEKCYYRPIELKLE